MPPSEPGVTGFDHQFTGSVMTVFSSTMEPVLPWSVQAVRHHPQALASLICTVFASGALRPLIWKVGSLALSLFSMFCWKLMTVPAALLLDGAAPAALCTLS